MLDHNSPKTTKIYTKTIEINNKPIGYIVKKQYIAHIINITTIVWLFIVVIQVLGFI